MRKINEKRDIEMKSSVSLPSRTVSLSIEYNIEEPQKQFETRGKTVGTSIFGIDCSFCGYYFGEPPSPPHLLPSPSQLMLHNIREYPTLHLGHFKSQQFQNTGGGAKTHASQKGSPTPFKKTQK